MKTMKFKPSEVGPIPVDWEVRKLGELFDFKNGYNADAKNYGRGTPVASVLDALAERPFKASSIRARVSAPPRDRESFSLKRGDLIFTRSSETLEDVGRSNVYDDDAVALFGAFVRRGRPKTDNNSTFINLLLKTRGHRDRVMSQGAGAQHYNIRQSGLERVLVSLPPLPEQKAIAEALSDVDALLAAMTKLIEKKRAIKQGAMQELLAGKKRLAGFTGEWVEKRFDDCFEHIASKEYQIQSTDYLNGGHYEVVDQGQNDVVGYTNDKAHLFKVPHGGVIIFGDHTRIVKYRQKDFVVGADGTQLLVGKEANTRFLSMVLQCKDIPNLGYARHFKFVKEGRYHLPSTLAEQQTIAAVLSDMDAEIAALEAEHAKYESIKQGMMQELLTGKTRLVETGLTRFTGLWK